MLVLQPYQGHMAAVIRLIWSLGAAVVKLLVWGVVWMLSAAYLHLRKCSTHLARLGLGSTRYGSGYSTASTSRSMATTGEGAVDGKLVEKIAKNVVQNVRSKEVRHT